MNTDADRYAVYEPGRSLRKVFPRDKIPMMQMEHLRQMDFMISRGMSYERTVNSFLQQLYLNESMRPLKMRESMVILLDRQGALVRDGGIWSLLFIPDQTETLSLEEDADLVPIYDRMLAMAEEGTMSRIILPQISERALLNQMREFVILDVYARTQPGGYLAISKDLVKNGPAKLYQHVPVLRCGALETMDVSEIESYNTIKELLQDYILQYDSRSGPEPLQPLSVAVFGAPGSGKSFGIKELAKSLKRFRIATLNCSQFDCADELFEALDRELNETADAIPLIFFDEFDSTLAGTQRGWLKYFLAPMQDGVYTLHGKVRSVNAAVFIFAGGTAQTFEQFVPPAQDEPSDAQTAFQNIKGPDFISRLKGILNIKGPNPTGPSDRRHLIRRALLIRELVIRKFPAIYEEKTGQISISDGLLSALLRVSEYRHGARSIEFLLAMSKLAGEKRFTPAALPDEKQLNIHIDVRDFKNKIMFEQMVGDGLEILARRIFENALTERGEKPDWDLAGEDVREMYRGMIRFLGEWMVDPGSHTGVRRMIPDAPDAIVALEGQDLEAFASRYQEGYVREMLQAGWKYDPIEDSQLRRSPLLVPYTELTPEKQNEIREDVGKYIKYLRGLGFEIFRRPYIS